jgi:hypothetical protein
MRIAPDSTTTLFLLAIPLLKQWNDRPVQGSLENALTAQALFVI